MTTPSTERKAGPLLGTGAQTTWPFTFKVFAATDIAVTIADSLGVETALTYGVDYTVTLNANQETSPGGTVTYPISGSPLPTGSRLVIVGNLPYDQPLDLPAGGNFSPLAIENQLDRTVMQIQQLAEKTGRALQVSITTDADVTLPPPAASQLIGWDSTGENLENVPLSELATAIAYGTYRYDTFTGDGTTTNFALSEDPAVLANLDVSISGVVQVPGVDYSLINGNLVFASAPANGTAILARYGQALTALPDSDQITFVQSGAGAVTRTVQNKLREAISVKDFGAVGNGVADDTAAIQTAMNYVKTSRQSLFFPAGTYLISNTLNYTTPNEMLHNDPKNGIHMYGEQGSVIKAVAGWTGTKAMLNLDGNPTASESVVAYVQQHNHIQKLEFDGSGVADRAIRLRANGLGKFEDLYLYDFDGSGLGVIDIVGVTTPTKDDADTTFGCLFLRVRIRGSASGYGVLGTNNRSSSLSFINCDIRDCFSDGIRLATAGLYMYGCIIAGCGNAGQNTTGGLSIVKGQTLARNRGVAIHGCEFENNYWHEINIDYCFGFTIEGCFGSPYTGLGRTGQSWIRCGGEAAQGGFIAGNSTMDYTHYGFDIRIYDMKAGASNIAIQNAVIQNPRSGDWIIDNAASQITRDGYLISYSGTKPSFMTRTTESAINIPNVTGDGTEYTTWTGGLSGFFYDSTPLVNFNNGGHLNAAADGTGGRFTAPLPGVYTFDIRWPVTGFDASMNTVEVSLISDYGGVSPRRFIVCKKKISSYGATDVEIFGGQLIVLLGQGETITAAIKISGGAKTCDIVRAAPSMFYWSGFAL